MRGKSIRRFTDYVRTIYEWLTDCVRTVYERVTDCIRTVYKRITIYLRTVCGLQLANVKKQNYYHETDLPSFSCDGGEVGRFFVNPGLLVMFHNDPKLSEKMFL